MFPGGAAPGGAAVAGLSPPHVFAIVVVGPLQVFGALVIGGPGAVGGTGYVEPAAAGNVLVSPVSYPSYGVTGPSGIQAVPIG
jgi:hypothetical protein